MRMSSCKNIFIIILNYNGYRDTIDCLSSLCALDCRTFHVVVIDNASMDYSVQEIDSWARGKFIVQQQSGQARQDELRSSVSFFNRNDEYARPGLLIVRNSENVGFAAACNQGIKIAQSSGTDYIWLLNNDTVVEPDSLSVLSDYLDDHVDCQVASPQIRLFDQPDRIWNCGGELKWYGVRKYFYIHRPITELPDKEILNITFVTGCAPLVRASVFRDLGGFTEQFFFGEEDFEFSLRMKKARMKMVCCLSAIIYHKVGASIDKTTKQYEVNKAYIHYLNRFINVKNYWPRPFWHVWRVVYSCYIYYLLNRHSGCDLMIRRSFIRKLFRESSALHGVNRKKFFKIINADMEYFLSQ